MKTLNTRRTLAKSRAALNIVNGSFDVLVLIASILVLGTIAVCLGVDGNGDLANYHYYIGWALLNKAAGYDIAPAGLQTYHHPLVDSMYFVLSRVFNRTPFVFTFIWSVPQSIAVWLSYLIAKRCAMFMGRVHVPLAVIAAVVGAGGATSLSVVGTSMSEAPSVCLLLYAILKILKGDELARSGKSNVRNYCVAGMLAGTSAVLKLTATPYLLAFGPTLILSVVLEPSINRFKGGVAFVVGAIIAITVFGGPWWWTVYHIFKNPLFPYYNKIFHSPFFPDENFFDQRFLPHGLIEWTLYPFMWAVSRTNRVSEPLLRDARVVAELLAAIGLIAAALVYRLQHRLCSNRIPLVWCAIYVIFSYAIWLKTFSILRYASGLEALSGVITICAAASLAPLTQRGRGILSRSAIGAAVATLLTVITVYPTWSRRQSPGKRLIGTNMPQLPPDSTALLFGPYGKAYLASFQPLSVRFIGVDNVLISMARRIGLDDLVDEAIEKAPGPVWIITDPETRKVSVDYYLDRFKMHVAGDCLPFMATLSPPLKLCRIER